MTSDAFMHAGARAWEDAWRARRSRHGPRTAQEVPAGRAGPHAEPGAAADRDALAARARPAAGPPGRCRVQSRLRPADGQAPDAERPAVTASGRAARPRRRGA